MKFSAVPYNKRGVLSLGQSETLVFATGQVRQPAALLGKEMDAFSHF